MAKRYDKDISDAELWQLCQQDNSGSYDELFHRYYPRVLRVASRYIKNRMEAEELCMDMMFNLWVKRKQITIESDLSNYLFRSIRNSVISSLRKNNSCTIRLDEIKEVCQTNESSDSRLLSNDFKQAYQNALKKLSPRRRQVFTLSRHNQLSYNGIAKRLSLSENTIENYMVAALDGLRKNMKEYLPIIIFIQSIHDLLSAF